MGEYFAFTEGIKQSGALHRRRSAPADADGDDRPRAQRQDSRTTDGPFAETKEQLGGYYLIEAKDLNDAIQVAAQIPSARDRVGRGPADQEFG